MEADTAKVTIND